MDDDDLFDDDIDDDDLLQAVDEALSARASQSTVSAPAVQHSQRPVAQQSNYSRPAHTYPNGRPPGAEHKPPPVQNAPPRRTLQRQISIPRQPVAAPPRQSQNLRQATLFGDTLDEDADRDRTGARPQAAYRNDTNKEPETHHDLDQEALDTWVYPMNLGAVRDYQYTIVKNSLFNNTLVALPTGLGKTFIAATVMLNFYRWTRTAQIVFVAPTKPLAAQQIDACFSIVGIPRSDTTLLTGEVSPGLRVEEWEKKRVFFMTPQTLQNDLSNGYADPKRIALLVVDEAHRAVGEYAYAKVVKFIRRFSRSIRVLALTATPGSKVDTVQEVIDNLGISHVEIRTEESLDIRQYVHRRDVEEEVLDFSEEIHKVRELFSLALQPLVDKLSQQNIYWGRDPMSLTQYGLVQTQKEWFAGPGRHANQGLQNMMRAVFGVLGSVAHSIKLLNFHGIKPFYDNMETLRSEVEGKGKGGSKYRLSLIKDKNFQEMMDTVEKWLSMPGFIGHPKLNVLSDRILNHFMDNPTQSSGSSTKIIVFSEYRDSAEEIVRVLNLHRPLVRASVFVGQADSKRSEGMKQAQQIKTIEDFRAGKFNVLVATSIGEEGLDIGQVDLIVCYDASSSPIRMLQRMGRTGRKRAGRIILLLMQGKEQDNYAKSKDSYAAMQKLICEGSRFNFRFDLSTRIVPRNKVPAVDKKVIDIPPENTQVQGLPEPKRTRAPKKKKPPKKFHMPDDAITGFLKASELDGEGRAKASVREKKAPAPVETDFVADVPPFHSVVLTQAQQSEFRRVYQLVHGNQEGDVCVDMGGHPEKQRRLGPTARLRHGEYTKRVVRLLSGLSKTEETRFPPSECPPYRHLPQPELVDSAGEGDASSTEEPAGRSKRRRLSEPSFTDDEEERQYEVPEPATSRSRPAKRKQNRPGGRGRGRAGNNQHATTFGGAGGDFCDSDEEIPDVFGDDGEDLRDFIVSDSEGSRPPTSRATTPLRSGSLAAKGTRKRASAAAIDMAIDGAMDLSDEDMPSLSQLMHPVSAPKSTHVRGQKQAWLVDSDDEDLLSDVAGGGRDVPGREGSVDGGDGELLGLTQRAARNRRVIEDSDSDGL